MTGRLLAFSALSICIITAAFALLIRPANAQNVTVSDISSYFCNQLDGTYAGGKCRAPYVPYKGGDACSIYEQSDGPSQPSLSQWFSNTTSSCSSSSIEEAMGTTLKQRASLRKYGAIGSEGENDPISNSSYRPEGATAGAGEVYFAAECAVRRCSSGGSAPPRSPEPADECEAGTLKCPDGKCYAIDSVNSCCSEGACARGQICWSVYNNLCCRLDQFPTANGCSGPQKQQQSTRSAPVPAENQLLFVIKSDYQYKIYIKFHSQNRAHWWPSKTTSYPLADSNEHQFLLNCVIGEKVCYGASTSNYKSHWGVGLKGDRSCSGCCLTCGGKNLYRTLN